MARFADRESAIRLRKQGMSYTQIKKIIGVSKSTLSCWLQKFPLSEEQIKEFQRQGWKKSEVSREKFRNTMRQKKEKRLRRIFTVQQKEIFPLTKRDIFLAGLFLYWGEGTKCRSDGLSISNSDPSIIKFYACRTLDV